MKTKIISLLAVAIAAVLISQPVLADITYDYFGLPFTNAFGNYTTRDFVEGMLTFASPLPPNLPLIGPRLTPLSFTFSDGPQTLTEQNSICNIIHMSTGQFGAIFRWEIIVQTKDATGEILTANLPIGASDSAMNPKGRASNMDQRSGWEVAVPQVSDTGSTLSLMTLTLMALGLLARRFQWEA